MATREEIIQDRVEQVITDFQNGSIRYYPYISGSTDVYKQRTKTFGTPISLTGRAILDPTSEQITFIGNGELFDIAFLFSRVELVAKFPSANEGEWLDVDAQIEWFNGRRYKIERVHPSGQIAEKFLLTIVLANSIEGQRD